jgi:hypothetical protein
MGKPRRHQALIAALAIVAFGAGGSTMAANGPRIEPLPITGLLRVQSADGSVVYMSTDRRFVFRGEMTDLWTGADTALGMPTNRVDLDRNGVSLDRISLGVGSGRESMTAFISPECEPCRALLEMMLDPKALKTHRFRVVLLDTTPSGARANAVVWCSSNPVEALRAVYLEGRQPRSAAKAGAECDRLGLAQAHAAAQLFGIAQLPMLVGADGVGHIGVPSSLAAIGRGEKR